MLGRVLMVKRLHGIGGGVFGVLWRGVRDKVPTHHSILVCSELVPF
jgi:hypothetical protein